MKIKGIWLFWISFTLLWVWVNSPKPKKEKPGPLAPFEDLRDKPRKVKELHYCKPKHNHPDKYQLRTDCPRCQWDLELKIEEHEQGE